MAIVRRVWQRIRTNQKEVRTMGIRDWIKKLESLGRTGETDVTLDRLNRRQTDALSDNEIRELIQARASQGKPIGKLAAAARDRGIDY